MSDRGWMPPVEHCDVCDGFHRPDQHPAPVTADVSALRARVAELEKQNAGYFELIGTLNQKLDETHGHRCLYCDGTVTEKTSRDQLAEFRAKALAPIQSVVNEQAEDEGLWFRARYATEAYLQRALRHLHAVVEGHDALSSLSAKEGER